MGLNSYVVDRLDATGYLKPTPIQAAFIPKVLAGYDVIGQAQTGTGKTASYLIPFLNHWHPREQGEPVGVILVPTRELAVQVFEEAKKISPHKGCDVVAIYGGTKFGPQVSALKRGCSLVAGTPGRVLDHLSRGTLSLAKVRFAVLDEADRMLDFGFRDDIAKILRRCPEVRQTLLLSATMPDPVLRLAKRYMRKPVYHLQVSPKKPTVDKIRQSYFTVDKHNKFELLLRLIEREKPRQCIIFCERKIGSQALYEKLSDHQLNAAAMHGDLQQSQRDRIMKGFREGKINYLVATDVVGRGIDVKGISHIINYDLPEDPENYVHRIGRTGRMGKDGIAISFVLPEQGDELTRIENFINREIMVDGIEGFQTFAPRVATPDEPKTVVPVYGRKSKKYSNRL